MNVEAPTKITAYLEAVLPIFGNTIPRKGLPIQEYSIAGLQMDYIGFTQNWSFPVSVFLFFFFLYC